jgi:hypothetical protein
MARVVARARRFGVSLNTPRDSISSKEGNQKGSPSPKANQKHKQMRFESTSQPQKLRFLRLATRPTKKAKGKFIMIRLLSGDCGP